MPGILVLKIADSILKEVTYGGKEMWNLCGAKLYYPSGLNVIDQVSCTLVVHLNTNAFTLK